jgi:hypothetical protein
MRHITDSDGDAWTEPEAAADLTDEILAAMRESLEWQDNQPRVDWDQVWDRMEGTRLADGTRLSLPTDTSSPVYRRLMAEGRKWRAALS